MVTDYLLYENIDNIAAAFYGRQAALANKKYPDEYLIRVSYCTQILCEIICPLEYKRACVSLYKNKNKRIKIANFILAV